jgi:hypothetical protein
MQSFIFRVSFEFFFLLAVLSNARGFGQLGKEFQWLFASLALDQLVLFTYTCPLNPTFILLYFFTESLTAYFSLLEPKGPKKKLQVV